MSNTFLLTISITCLLSIEIMAQKNITTTALLSENIKTSVQNLPYAENLTFYDTHKKGLPIINEIGFRTETDEFNYLQQEYQIRFKFNSKKERRAVNQLITANAYEYTYKQEIYRLSKLSALYTGIIDWYFVNENRSIQKKKSVLLADKRRVYLKLMKTGAEFDLNKWLSNEEEIMGNTTDSLQSVLDKQAILAHCFTDKKGVDLRFDNWLSLANLRLSISEITSLETKNLALSLAKIDEAKAIAEYDLETAKAKKWFDFAQIKYKGNKKNPWNEEISLGVSFTIPTPSSNRHKKNEAALEVLESKYKTQLLVEKKQAKQAELISKLTQLFMIYELTEQFILQQKLQETYDTYLNGFNNLSPLDFIELKKMMLKQKRKQLKIKKEIYLTYIDLLTISGTLLQPPLRNFLTNGQEGL